jgi:hypothetical protein
MRLVMTLLARDEADIVDAQIAFHLSAGVDFVIATDNASRDGTTEILERYARDGVLHLLHEPGDDMRQSDWVTRMARLAATDFGADWVINADADEFWWPRGGSLKEVLAAVPERYGVVRGCWRHFLPRPDDGSFFAERMTARLRTPAHPGAKATIFHAHQKVAHRGRRDVVVEAGNHDATAPGLESIHSWHPFEVLHFSFRSVGQLERKARGGWYRNATQTPTLHQLLLREALEEERMAEYYELFVLGDDVLAKGLADGTLALDTRLRDALRAIRSPDGGRFSTARGSRALVFDRPTAGADAEYAAEAAVLVDVDGPVRAELRVEALERRIGRLERGLLARLRARLGTREALP